MKPVEKATWWIEYVCRNGMDGGEMLKPIFSDIPWYQYHHLDTLLALIFSLSVAISIVFSLCLSCSKICCWKSSKQKKKDE